MILHPVISCCQENVFWEHYTFSRRIMSAFLKDKPVGGTLTGPAGCESSRLVLTHIIRFYFLQNFDRPFHLQCYLGYPVNWEQATR